MFRRDADARVDDMDLDERADGACPQDDAAAFVRSVDGVVQQVHDDLVNASGVSLQLWQRVEISFDFRLLAGGADAQDIEHGGHALVEIDALPGSIVAARDVPKILNDLL